MKLKEFNSENCITVKSRTAQPYIAINTKTGLFRLNQEACELLGVKEGHQVIFHQDEESPEDWYVEKVKEKGFAVRFKEAVGKGVLFNNTVLARQIADSVAFEGKSGRILMAGQPTPLGKRKLFGLLTGTLRN